jgi:hypothetical protein
MSNEQHFTFYQFPSKKKKKINILRSSLIYLYTRIMSNSTTTNRLIVTHKKTTLRMNLKLEIVVLLNFNTTSR